MQQRNPAWGKHRRKAMRSGVVNYCQAGVLLGFLLLTTPAVANIPVTIRGTITLPPACKINDDKIIKVDFGDDVMISRIDGANYKQPILYSLDCGTPKTNDMKMSIQGNTANFGAGLLRTTKSGLGIAIYHESQKVYISDWFNFIYPSKPNLEAVLVKEAGATLTGGEFTAAATLLVDYQ